MKILLIAGHGAGDSGATGCGYKEANLTREVVKMLKQKLEKYATVEIADTSVNWFNAKERLPLNGVDYALEVHFNACVNDQKGNGVTTGTEIFVTTREVGIGVEENIIKNISALGLKNRGVKRKNFSVINHIKNQGIAAALLELCFIDDADDMKIYTTKTNNVIDAIVKGIVDGFSLNKTKKVELSSPEEIIKRLIQEPLKVEILDVPRAIQHLEKAQKENSSLYWILKKIVNA